MRGAEPNKARHLSVRGIPLHIRLSRNRTTVTVPTAPKTLLCTPGSHPSPKPGSLHLPLILSGSKLLKDSHQSSRSRIRDCSACTPSCLPRGSGQGHARTGINHSRSLGQPVPTGTTCLRCSLSSVPLFKFARPRDKVVRLQLSTITVATAPRRVTEVSALSDT